MTGHCKDCRWWERRQSSPDWRPCALTRTHDEREEYPQSRATASATLVDAWEVGSQHAVLLTTAAFGCVQWEARG